jgi:hypothetical protein
MIRVLVLMFLLTWFLLLRDAQVRGFSVLVLKLQPSSPYVKGSPQVSSPNV